MPGKLRTRLDLVKVRKHVFYPPPFKKVNSEAELSAIFPIVFIENNLFVTCLRSNKKPLKMKSNADNGHRALIK